MSILDFLSTIIASVSWPITIIVLVYLLRNPIGKLIPNIQRIRYGKVEFDFGIELQELEGKAKTAGLRIHEGSLLRHAAPRTAEDSIADAARLVEEFPEPAVGVAWLAVEHELSQAVGRLAISADYPPYNSAMRNIILLHECGYIDQETRGVLDRMRRLRNAAVHAIREHDEITAEQAREFVALAEAVARSIKEIER